MFDIKENEESILKFWDDHKIFEKSVKRDPKLGDFSFYDGPPFATGLPHYGHIIASVLKDIVPRYKTMQGYRVERRWGWDCHGLPVENLIEQELGFKTKKDIEDYGVENFNNACKSSVLRYADEWKKFIPRIGRWVDMEDDYKTMTPDFMESIWWVFKELYDKELVYKGYKAMHICPRCETTLSNFEVTLGYKDVTDLSVTCKFKLKGKDNEYILGWTTTPWTLLGNVALAINKNVQYVKIKVENPKLKTIKSDEIYILAKDTLNNVLKDEEYTIIDEINGEDLIGLEYEPLFDYFANDSTIDNKKNGWKIYHGNFVTTTDGTGVVHIAPAFGEDDMNLGKEYNLPFIQHVKMNGYFTSQVKDFIGHEVKPKDNPSETDTMVVDFLTEKNRVFSKQKYLHSYPHCWRCDTPLLNYATSSWFVKVTDIKDDLIDNNNKIHWVPDHVRTGRFGKWLENARDWAVSRSRFWGTPLPVWICENEKCNHIEVIGSVEDLYQKMKDTDDKERLTKLIVIRHGESEKNIKHISWSKDELYPLTEKGRQDMERIANEIDKYVDVILCSPVLRARESAEIINKKLNKKIVIVEELRETIKGSWEGENMSEEGKKDLEYYRTLKGNDRFLYKRGGGESFEDVEKRVNKFIDSLKQYKGKKVLIITHNGIKVSIESILKEWEIEKFFSILDKDLFNKIEIYLDNKTNKEFDLHKQVVDNIEFKCPDCGVNMKRIPEVFDCWFESGSMPYSSFHYPMENVDTFNKRFPAKFIAEGQDQTRGWFYTLMVLATALFNKPAFENVVVNGIVLAENGQKMSKRLKNYPDPYFILDKYGADALRYYLLSSPVVNCEDLNFSEKGVDDVVKKVILKLVNVLEFYNMANVDHIVEEYSGNIDRNNNLDVWIYAKMNEFIINITEEYDGYYLADGTRLIEDFIDDLSNWYLRRSRMRLKSNNKDERYSSLSILREILMTLSMVIAPSMPFIAEYIYQSLKIDSKNESENFKRESVHLCDWPKPFDYIDSKKGYKVIKEMDFIKTIVSLGLAIRKQKNIAVKQPLSSINIVVHDADKKNIENNRDIILEELNVKNIGFIDNIESIAKKIAKPNARLIGPKFGKDVQEIINKAKNGDFEISEDRIIVDKKWELSKDECEISYVSINKEEEIKEENGIIVSLDTKITEELKNEGYIREIISFINKLRAEKNLSIKDKIDIKYSTDSEVLKSVINDNIAKIQQLVLANNIIEEENKGEVCEVGDYKIILSIYVGL